MANKNKIGALVILGGIALLGYVYFKKTKPTVAQTQLQGLKNLNNYYGSGTGAQEDTKIDVSYIPQQAGNVVVGGLQQSMLTNLDYTKLTPKENEDLKNKLQSHQEDLDHNVKLNSQELKNLQDKVNNLKRELVIKDRELERLNEKINDLEDLARTKVKFLRSSNLNEDL